MTENIEEQVGAYQILVCNIHWGNRSGNAVKRVPQADLPDQMTLDVPKALLAEIEKKPSEESSIVESFTYNLLYKKFGREVNSCQIWLPLK